MAEILIFQYLIVRYSQVCWLRQIGSDTCTERYFPNTAPSGPDQPADRLVGYCVAVAGQTVGLTDS